MTAPSDTGSCERDTLPDSMTARSRISLISFSRCQPASRIWVIRPDWAAVGGGAADSISWAKPRMALSGLRSSWLMLERKSDLARLAFSAADLAISRLMFVSWSARSKRFRSVTSRAAANTPCNFLSRS